MTTKSTELAQAVLWLRLAQMLINERYKDGQFKIPIHLAMGHEAIAVAVSQAMTPEDALVLPHRNVHYNLARAGRVKPILEEFLLFKDGLGGARLGSMNLANPDRGVLYSSSILGNGLCVASGVGLGLRVRRSAGVVFVVTGDGAIEEGAFTETLAFMRTYDVSAVVVIENNGWSLSTKIAERRCEIHVDRLASAFEIQYQRLNGNDVHEYARKLREARSLSLQSERPVILEVDLDTLGDWRADPDGRYINYHAGPAPTVELNPWPLLRDNHEDPVYALLDHLDLASLKRIAEEQLAMLQSEIV